MIPLLHDFDGETVLIFGGGSVGARKARRFAREADVVVVSPTFVDDESDSKGGPDGDAADPFGGAERVRERPDSEDVPSWLDRVDPTLAVAATDDVDLNDAVEREASARGVLVNRADESGARDAGSVVVPATVRDDPVVAAVATGGLSPALSRHLREQLESEIEGAGEMAELTADLRAELRSDGVPAEERRTAVRAVVTSDRVWKALDSRNANPRRVAADVIDNATDDATGETA